MIKNEKFTKALKTFSPQINSSLIVDGKRISDSDDLIEWEYELESETFIGGFPCAKLTASIFYSEDEPPRYEAKQAEVVISAGGEDVRLGYFNVLEDGQDTDPLKKRIKLTALDRADKANVLFNASTIKYPVLVKEFISEVIKQCGLQAVDSSQLLDDIVLQKQPNFGANTTCRQLISHYAQASFKMAVMNRDGLIEFKDIKAEPVETLSHFDIYNQTIEALSDPITTLVLSRQPQEDNIYSGEALNARELKIANNIFVDFIRQEVIDRMAEYIKGYIYTPFSVDMFARADIDPGDVIEVQDKNSNKRSIYCNVKYKFNGGLIATISCPKIGETMTDYKISGTSMTIYNTEILVDKVNQEISSVVEKTTENESNITKLTQDIDKLTLTITDGGGSNLLKNSVGYAGVKFWESTKGIESETSTWFLENTTSKHGFVLSPQTNISTILKQTVRLKKDTDYTVNFKLNREQDVNRFMVKLISGSGEVIEVLDNQPNTEVGTQHKLNFNTNHDSDWRLEISLTNGGSKKVEISDIGIYEGRNVSTWQQNAGETYTINIQQDSEGISVFSIDGKSKTIMSPQEFAGYYNDKRVFTLNGDLTQVQALEIMGGGLLIRPIKIIQNRVRNALVDTWVGW